MKSSRLAVALDEVKRFQPAVRKYRYGSRVIFEGPPADLVAGRSTLTGEQLADYVGGGGG